MELNEKLAPIWGRRSIRAYRREPIPEPVMTDLLRAAMAAPSAAKCDPWRFVVVQNSTVLAGVAKALPHGKFVATAPAAVVVCGDLGAAHDGQLSYLLQDCSAAIENLLIAAHLLGLGACWLGVHPRGPRIDAIRHLLRIPTEIVPVSVIAVGYPDEEKEARTRYMPRHVHQNRW